jgi:cytochrome c oxidase cbb3-type subunit 3
MFLGALGLLVALAGCKREAREFQVSPPAASQEDGLRLTSLQPGPASPTPPVPNEYEENAQALSEGKRLYESMNCVGCHAHGGGDKGPALIDDKWIYGSRPEQIFATIMQGRPNGMPSFRGKLPAHQAWQIVAYVRSMSGQVSEFTAPNREDHMKTNPPENSVDPVKPRPAGSPPQ